MNIAIITPVYGHYPSVWVNSLLNTLYSSKHTFDFISPSGASNITSARNTCIQEVFIHEEQRKSKFDKLIFIDSDISFTPNDIEKIISVDENIVSGVYFAKSAPFFPVAGYYNLEKIENGFPKITKEQVLSGKKIEVDWAGCGFLSISRHIIDKIEYPWFDMRVVNLKNIQNRSGGFTISKEILSEDISFCIKIKELGYKIFVDTSILLKHFGNTNFSIDHFLAFSKDK